jgi:ankyrin repeat protein
MIVLVSRVIIIILQNGFSALLIAIEKEHIEVCKMLLDSVINVDKANKVLLSIIK